MLRTVERQFPSTDSDSWTWAVPTCHREKTQKNIEQLPSSVKKTWMELLSIHSCSESVALIIFDQWIVARDMQESHVSSCFTLNIVQRDFRQDFPWTKLLGSWKRGIHGYWLWNWDVSGDGNGWDKACLFKQRQSQMEHPESTNRRQNLRNDKHAMLARCDVYIYIRIYIYLFNYNIYPLVNWHNYRKSPFWIGKSTINGVCSIAILT